MIRNLGKKLVAAALTATMLMSVVIPTAFAATPEMTSKKVRINAISDDILKVLEKKEAHMQSLEITDVSFNIERDFDQSCYVTVKNTGTENAVFFLSVDNPYSDIYLGFIDAGSATQPTLLTAGASTRVKLSVFAQRAEKNKYTLPVKAYIVDGVNNILDNEAEVELNLPDETLNFTCDLTSSDEETLEQNYLITNNGGKLSSVSIYADEALDKYVLLTPGVSETPMKANESVSIKVTPDFTAMKEDNLSRVSGNLVISAAGKEKKFSVVIDTQGKDIYSVTMKDLIQYQKSGKAYFNLSLDSQTMADSLVIENNGSSDAIDENTDCTVSYKVPFIDDNTGQKLAEATNKFKISAYDGNKPSGTMLNKSYVFDEEKGIVTVKYSIVVSSDDIKYGIMSRILEDNNDTGGETEVNADEDESSAALKNVAKLVSAAINNKNKSGDAGDVINDVAESFGTWAPRVYDGTALVIDSQQVFNYGLGADVADVFDSTKNLGQTLKNATQVDGAATGFQSTYAWVGFAANAYNVIDHSRGTDHFYDLDKVLDTPNSVISGDDKERYVKLGIAKDTTNLLLSAGTILMVGVSGPVGWGVCAAMFVGSWIFNAWVDSEMNEISDRAQGEDGEGGSDTYPNKRNQCTNAQRIGAPVPNFPSVPDTPTPTPTAPPTDPPTAPTDPPTAPTEPPTNPPTAPPTVPPTNPTSPTSPTKPTEPATSKPPKKKWTFYLKASPEPGIVGENVKLTATAKNVDISKNFKFKFSYRTAGSWNWKDITGWTDTPTITTKFKKDGKYILRVVIKSTVNTNFWVGVEKDFYVNLPSEYENSYIDSELKGAKFNPSHNMMLVTTRLQAGDESANDKVMTTSFRVSGKSNNSSNNYVKVGKTVNNGCSNISMQMVDMSSVVSAFSYNGGSSAGSGSYSLVADFSTTQTHFRTVSDMEIIHYYPINSSVNYIGNLDNYRDITLKSDFAVYEENIYVDGKFYVNEPTTLHCDVFNRNLAGGWVDIVVKDGDDVIYSAEDVWMGRASANKIEIPWTPQTKDSQISVKLTNKSMVTKEFATDNNFAERKLTAIDYQVPEIGDIQTTTALENREFAISSIIQKTQNVTDVKMYIDGTEINGLQSSVSGTDIKKYWYNCQGLTAGNHTVKILATYEKAGGNFAIAEKSLDFSVVSNAESCAVINKNSSTGNTNLSADLYNGNNYSGTYKPDESGVITIPFTTSMYQHTSNYKVVVNTTKGIFITDLKAGTIKVNNNYVQNTFNVKGMSSIRYAILYIKDSDEYYQQLAYKYLNGNGMRVFYFDEAAYTQFAQTKDAYLLVVTGSGTMHKLDIIKNGVRVTNSSGSITVSDENIYQPLASSSKAVGVLIASAAGVEGASLKSSWNTSYQGKANISVSAFGSEIVNKAFANGKTTELPYNDYVIDYTLKSDNYVFEVEKELSLNSESVTNRIENSFSGKISHQETAEAEETISVNAYDMADKNGNMLKYVSAVRNKPVTATIKFTDVNDSSNVVTRTFKLDNFNGNIENVAVPDKAGDYKLSISMTLVTETTMVGDLDSDGKINGTDVSLMKKFIYGVQTPTSKQKTVADIDGSGTIDKNDLTLLKEMLA